MDDVIENVDLSGFSAETLASLDRAAGMESDVIGEIESDADMAAAKKARAAEREQVDGWREAVGAARDIVCSTYPEADPVWSNDRMDALAGAMARCDAIYGWGGVGGLFANPMIGLAVAAYPLAVGTAKAIGKARTLAAPDAPPGAISTDPMGQALAPAPA